LTRSQLRPYQPYFSNLVVQQAVIALWLDMGAGKTVITLTAVADLLMSFEVGKVLVVAPKRVATDVWPDEIGSWQHTKWMPYSVLVGPVAKREKAAFDPAPVHIINRENIPWLVQLHGRKWPYDMVIWDESSGLKNHKRRTGTGRLSRFGAVCSVRKHMDRFVELTGTPAPKGYIDLWAQVFLLDAGVALGRTVTSFRRRWFDEDYTGWTYTLRKGAAQEIETALDGLCYSLPAEYYPKLPPVTYNNIPVSLPDTVARQYRDFAKEYLLDLPEDESLIEAKTAAILTNKLLQFANGCVYDGERQPHEVHSAKLEALDDLIESAAGHPVLVAYSYKTDMQRIKQRYPQAVVLNQEDNAVRDWNAGKIDILLVHPQSGGHGLNLQFGGSIIVWFGLTWSLEQYQQLNKRLHRPGQTRPSFIHHLLAKGTLDYRVLEVLAGRSTLQHALVQARRLLLK